MEAKMKMVKKIMSLAVLISLVGFAFAGGSQDSSKKATAEKKAGFTGNYTFGGSTTVAPIANAVIEAMVAENSGLKITYEGLGSSTGLKGLPNKTFSLAGSSRDLKQSELDAGCTPVVIARDGIAIVVNKDVSLANIDIKDLAKVFAGELTNWSQLGGSNEKIEVVNRDESSGTYGSFKEIVLDENGYKKVGFTKNAIVAKENGEVAAKVASTPGAIGYVGLGFVEEIIKAGGKALLVNGIPASVDTVLDGTYPVSRALYMATLGVPATGSLEEAFINYSLSKKGAMIVAEAGFVPLQ